MSVRSLKVLNSLVFVFMIIMNTLANALPLGGKDTGELSALYPNLFVPAGFTFAIWGVIYLLLLLFVLWQWFGDSDEVIKKIGPWFIVNAIANGTWIAVWHAQWVWVSLLVMLVILGSLIKIYTLLDIKYPKINWAYKVPFSVYLGWISVATIANTTTVFVDNGIDQLGLGAGPWAAIMLSIAGILAIIMLWVKRDIFFSCVVIWAAYGIYSKRMTDLSSLDGIVETVALAVMVIVSLLTLLQLIAIVKVGNRI